MQISPALGVIEWTKSGRSRLITRHICHNERKSFINEMCRSIGTAMVRTPSRRDTLSSASPGEETATTSYSWDSSFNTPLQNESNDWGTVALRIIFNFLLILIL
jgi:hypothetical protein